MYLKGGENLNFAIPINDAKQLLPSGGLSSLHSFPNEQPEQPLSAPSSSASSDPPSSDASSDPPSSGLIPPDFKWKAGMTLDASTMCIAQVRAGTKNDAELPGCVYAIPPFSLSPGDRGLHGKVCIILLTLPSGMLSNLGVSRRCPLVASLPFSLSKADSRDYKGMENHAENVDKFARFLFEDTDQKNKREDKELIDKFAEVFHDLRKEFCGRHPEMAIFNYDGFSKTDPQPCTDNSGTPAATITPTREISKESHAEATPSPDHECWELAAKATLDARTSYYPDEPRTEYTSHYDPKSAKCYVESGLYWSEGKKYPPSKTYTGWITVRDAHNSEGKNYGFVVFGPNSTILECQISSPLDSGPPQHCTSKEQFEELALKYFRIDRHQPQPPPVAKVSVSLPFVGSASEGVQILVDLLKFCHENPTNNVQLMAARGSTTISCQDATATIEEARLESCGAKPESKTKKCKDLLKAVKQYRTGTR